MKLLLVTFSDNADHQDIAFGMFESLYKSRRHDVDVWVMGIKDPKVSLIKTSHTKLVDCPKRPGIEKKTFDIKTLNSIVKWINHQHFDVIFFESLHVWNLAIMMCCHKNTKIFQMIHDLIPHQGDKQEKSVILMNKIVCNLADYIVLANRKYISKVEELYKVPRNRVRYVDMWRRFPEYTEPKYTKHALFFGRMNPYKGVDNLLKIVKACPEVHFDVVGRVDPQVQSYVNELKKQPNVSINNNYVSDDEMARAFINADWIVLPYNTATQSGVVIDGYRYGRPCIAFNVGAISEQIEDNRTGFLVSEGDCDAFVKRLKTSISMPIEDFVQMSKEAYNYGTKKYSSSGAIDRFLEIIS